LQQNIDFISSHWAATASAQEIEQVAQLSQRDRAARWDIYGQKWKTGTGENIYGHYRSIFNHSDLIGQQSNRIR